MGTSLFHYSLHRIGDCIIDDRSNGDSYGSDRLGPLAADRIEQRGEAWQQLSTPFHILDWPHLQQLRLTPGVLTS